MEYGEFSASILVFTREWLKHKFPPEKYAELMGKLPPEDRKYWEQEKLSLSAMLPARIYRNFLGMVMPVFSAEPEALLRDAAANTAAREVIKSGGTFLQKGIPSFVAQQMIIAWRHYFSVGALSVEEYSQSSITLALEFAESYGKGSCLGTEGWGRGALEYAGAKDVRTYQTECVFRGDSRCLIHLDWK